ncbi:hypothetical protein AMS68_006876 [Peltaster fructicola]|uniref:Uncharacterized protein n=1 Tax=Peltaster fructicola TaxID=286661 RepID=A0A6H0Y3C7_9PEZI|nr:hypothetical protein AMS68_006876 [Peltaster fructicola]
MAAYSWPSGSTCPGCDTPLQLTGTGFQDSDVLARFVLVCMSLVVAFGCVVYSVASRLFLTFGAAFATAVYLALVVLTDTVTEKSMTTTYAFFIVNVFVVASGYLAVILTLAALGQLVGARLAIPSFVLAVLALVSVDDQRQGRYFARRSLTNVGPSPSQDVHIIDDLSTPDALNDTITQVAVN